VLWGCPRRRHLKRRGLSPKQTHPASAARKVQRRGDSEYGGRTTTRTGRIFSAASTIASPSSEQCLDGELELVSQVAARPFRRRSWATRRSRRTARNASPVATLSRPGRDPARACSRTAGRFGIIVGHIAHLEVIGHKWAPARFRSKPPLDSLRIPKAQAKPAIGSSTTPTDSEGGNKLPAGSSCGSDSSPRTGGR
jgi:hypothetical protein